MLVESFGENVWQQILYHINAAAAVWSHKLVSHIHVLSGLNVMAAWHWCTAELYPV